MRKLLFVIGLLYAGIASGQDILFSQPFFAPLSLGPALAGGANTPRVNFLFKNQWPRLQGGFRETYMSFDQPSKLLHGGAGGYYHQSRDTNGITYYRMYAGANYSAMSGNGSVRFVFGAEAGYIHGTLKFQEYDNAPEGIYRSEVNSVDVGLSGAVHSRRYSVIASAQHLNRPQVYFNADQESRLAIKYSVTATAIIPIGGRYGDANISPFLYYTSQADTANLQLGIMFNKNRMLWALSYRNNSSLNISLGLRFDRFRLMYTYDVAVSPIVSRRPGNAHEVGIMLYLKPQDTRDTFHSVEHNGFDSQKDYSDGGSR